MNFVLIDEYVTEKILSERCKESLRQEQYEVHSSLEYRAMKTIVAKQLDIIIDHYSEEDIRRNIEISNQSRGNNKTRCP